MVDAFLYLAPDFLFQTLLAVLLLWLFANRKNEGSLVNLLFIGLCYTVLNILIEWSLQAYLFSTTLVIQWCFFTLIANRFVSIPLPRAALTLFCYFAILMGTSLVSSEIFSAELSEHEKLLTQGFDDKKSLFDSTGEEQAEWVVHLKSNLIAYRSLEARAQIRSLLYPTPEVVEPPPAPVEKLDIVTWAPPKDTVKVTQLSGKEFEERFFSFKTEKDRTIASTPPSPPVTQTPSQELLKTAPRTQSISSPQPVTGIQTEVTRFQPEVTRTQPAPRTEPAPSNVSNLLKGEDMSAIVNIRNRSTDPGYDPPSYDVSALSMGVAGRFAIINGEIIKEGTIIRTQLENPRGWRLFKIAKNQVYWQPLK